MTWLAPPKSIAPPHECALPCEAGGIGQRPDTVNPRGWWTQGNHGGGVWRCDECGQRWLSGQAVLRETPWLPVTASQARRIVRKAAQR